MYTVKGIAILDNDGNRLFAKYYDADGLSTFKEQKNFEKKLFSKTSRANSEIIIIDGFTCLYKSNIDLFFYVLGNVNENELLLSNVLNCVYESICLILHKNVEKRNLIDNLDAIMLVIDEIVDKGIILEADPEAIAHKVSIRSEDIPIGEQSVSQVLQTAKEQLKWSLLK
ncbi:coatomer subunit zeta-1-like isoform X2 [Artemia franciscana]|nr:hypothetical protein QYM36_013307 [Artemia franciscana]KAK2709592.1 hypothetical protein QYM36_013307 [Artemia franciscana]